MTITSLASHMDAASRGGLEHPTFTPRPSVDGKQPNSVNDGQSFESMLRNSTFTPRPTVDGAQPAGSDSGHTLQELTNAFSNGSGLARSMLGGTLSHLAGNAGGGSATQAAGPASDGTAAAQPDDGGSDKAKMAGETLLDALPIVGNLMSGFNALKDASQGNLGGAAADVLGALPGVGNGLKLTEGATKLGKDLTKSD